MNMPQRNGGRDGRAPLCRQFPRRWADRLWGLDEELTGTRAGRELARAGALICRECPVRVVCLASAIVCKDRSGILGGLSWTMRKQVARLAALDGLQPEGSEHKRTMELARCRRQGQKHRVAQQGLPAHRRESRQSRGQSRNRSAVGPVRTLLTGGTRLPPGNGIRNQEIMVSGYQAFMKSGNQERRKT